MSDDECYIVVEKVKDFTGLVGSCCVCYSDPELPG